MNMVSCVSKVNEWKDFHTVLPFFFCVLSKMTTVLRLFITIYIRMMSQRFDAFKINLFCLFDSAEKNLINNASDVSTYGCLCGGATSFSKTSVVKKPREED